MLMDNKKTNKSEVVNVRLTKKERKKLEKQRLKCEMGLSEYIRCRLFTSEKFNKDYVRLTVKVTEILNYISEIYGEDTELEERIDDLWNSLS